MIKNLILRTTIFVLFLTMIIPLFSIFSPAAAAVQAWSKLSLPATEGYVLAPYLDGVGCMDISLDGSATYAAASESGHSILLKSIDFGRSWIKLSNFPDIYILNTPERIGILDIVCSPVEANTLFVTDGYEIYKSIDGGNSWVSLANAFTTLGLVPGFEGDGYIVSLDIGYYHNAPFLFAATSTYGGGKKGHALVFQEANYFSPWSDMQIATARDHQIDEIDVIDIRCSSDFSDTQTVLAVVTDYNFDYTGNQIDSSGGAASGPATLLTTKPATSGWASTAGDIALVFTQGQSKYAVDCTLYKASIWTAADFSLVTGGVNAIAFVGIDPVVNSGNPMCGDVYLCNFTAPDPSGISTQAIDLNVSGIDTSTFVSDLQGTGNFSDTQLIASGFSSVEGATAVWTSGNIGNTWTTNAKSPTGGISTFDIPEDAITLNIYSSSLCLNPAYATNGTALVSTQGADCGVSMTTDSGKNWNTVSLIRNSIDNIEACAVQADGSIYLSTTESDNFYSLWRFASGHWERVLSESIFDNDVSWNFLAASTSDNTVFMGEANTGYIWYSVDGGQYWRRQQTVNPAGTIGAWTITGPNSMLVAGDTFDEAYYTTSNGIVWQTQSVPGIGQITSLAVASNGHFLAGGIKDGVAKIARSTDSGITWKTLTADVPFSIPTNVMVAFSYDYAESGQITVTGADEDSEAGVWSWTFDVSAQWTRRDVFIFGSGNPVVSEATGMVIAPGGPGNDIEGSGMIYITDSSSGEGISRIRGKNNTVELLKVPAVPSNLKFTQLWVAPATNAGVQLFTVGSDGNIYTYTDALNAAGNVNYDNLTDSSVRIYWEAIPGATRYKVFVTSDAPVTDVYTTSQVASFLGSGTSFTIDSLEADTQYFVAMWADAPVTSFQANTLDFITPPASPSYSTHFSPSHGAYNVPVDINFAWDAPAGVTVTGYTLEYGIDPDFFNALKVEIESTQTYYSPRETLEYSTTYYWRVATLGAGGPSVFVASVFTTESAPQPLSTALIPPAPPTLTFTFTIPQQTVVPATVVITTPKTTSPAPTYVLPEEDTPMVMWILVSLVAGSSIITPLLLIAAVRSRKG